jgi:hypothetical protein
MRSYVHIAAIVVGLAPGLATAGDTEWLVAPYGWLPTVNVDQTFDDGSGGGGSSSGAEVLSKIDFVAMFRVEASRGRWGAMLDYIYLSLADQTTFSPLPAIRIDIDGDLDLDVLELGAFYRLSDEAHGVDLMLGVRRIDIDLGLVLTRQNLPSQPLDVAAEVDDLFLGARYRYPFGKRWDFNLRGDYGFGDSDGTVNLIAGIGVQFNDTFGMKFGYRHADLELEVDVEGSPETMELLLSGPYVGLLFRF